MKGRPLAEVRCPKGRHVVARAYVDRVELRAEQLHRGGVAGELASLPWNVLLDGDEAAVSFPLTCPCGARLVVDLVALRRGDGRVRVVAPGTLESLGLSSDRLRKP